MCSDSEVRMAMNTAAKRDVIVSKDALLKSYRKRLKVKTWNFVLVFILPSWMIKKKFFPAFSFFSLAFLLFSAKIVPCHPVGKYGRGLREK
jgi:hypothetical protein